MPKEDDVMLKNADGALIQGIIDLLILDPGGAVLVDYKTSRGGEEYLKAAYSEQLRIYSEAVERISGLKVARRVIYSFENGKEIEV